MLEIVADDDGRYAAVASASDDPLHLGRLLRTQRCRRLVEQQKLAAAMVSPLQENG
jgi:hypothetical protein